MKEVKFANQPQIIPTTNDIFKSHFTTENGRVVNVDYRKIGHDLSSIAGKISRFFVLVCTLSLIDLYDTRGRTAYKDWLKTVGVEPIASDKKTKESIYLIPNEDGKTAIKNYQEQVEKIKRLQEKQNQPVIEEIPEENKEIKEVAPVEQKEVSNLPKIKEMLKKGLVSNVKSHIEKNKKFQEDKTFDEAAEIFIAHYLDDKEPQDLELAQKAFSYFLDFARPDNITTDKLKFNLKILVIALKNYPKMDTLENYVHERHLIGKGNDLEFIKYYNQKIETSLNKENIQPTNIEGQKIVEPKGNSVEANLDYMFDDKKTPKKLKEFKEKNEEKYNQALKIFTQVYLENKSPQNWEIATESFQNFIDFIRPDNKETKDLDINLVVLAKALKSHKNTNSKDKLVTFYSNARNKMIENILDDVLQKTHLSAKKDELLMGGILNEIKLSEIPSGNEISANIKKQVLNQLDARLNDIEALLKLIKVNPFAAIKLFFGKAVTRLPEAKEGLEEILAILEKHQDTLNDGLFGEFLKDLIEISELTIEKGKKYTKRLGLDKQPKKQATSQNNSLDPTDFIINMLTEAKNENRGLKKFNEHQEANEEIRKRSLICGMLDKISSALKGEEAIKAFEWLSKEWLLELVGTENGFFMGLKKFGLNIGLKFIPTEEKLSEETTKLLEDSVLILAKFMKKVLPAMKVDQNLKPIIEKFVNNIFTPILENKGKVKDEDIAEAFLDMALIMVNQIKG